MNIQVIILVVGSDLKNKIKYVNNNFYRVKSSQELELEELERIPKFKARPLDKKVCRFTSVFFLKENLMLAIPIMEIL